MDCKLNEKKTGTWTSINASTSSSCINTGRGKNKLLWMSSQQADRGPALHMQVDGHTEYKGKETHKAAAENRKKSTPPGLTLSQTISKIYIMCQLFFFESISLQVTSPN